MTALPEKMERAERIYDEGSLWWQTKRLSLLVAVDEERFAAGVRKELAEIEARFAGEAETVEASARALMRAGKCDEAKAALAALTARCTEELYTYAKRTADAIAEDIREMGGMYGRQKEAIEAYAAYAEMPLP